MKHDSRCVHLGLNMYEIAGDVGFGVDQVDPPAPWLFSAEVGPWHSWKWKTCGGLGRCSELPWRLWG